MTRRNNDMWPEITASHQPFTIKVKTVREVVNDFLDTYNRQLLGSKEAEQLIKELEDINN